MEEQCETIVESLYAAPSPSSFEEFRNILLPVTAIRYLIANFALIQTSKNLNGMNYIVGLLSDDSFRNPCFNIEAGFLCLSPSSSKTRIINHADIILNGIEKTDEAPPYVEDAVRCHTAKRRVTEQHYQELLPFLNEYAENLFTPSTDSHHNDFCMLEGDCYLQAVRRKYREDIFNKNKEFEISQLIFYPLVSLLEQFSRQPFHWQVSCMGWPQQVYLAPFVCGHNKTYSPKNDFGLWIKERPVLLAEICSHPKEQIGHEQDFDRLLFQGASLVWLLTWILHDGDVVAAKIVLPMIYFQKDFFVRVYMIWSTGTKFLFKEVMVADLRDPKQLVALMHFTHNVSFQEIEEEVKLADAWHYLRINRPRFVTVRGEYTKNKLAKREFN
ncbi:hypothetical protein C8J55DRAFT_556095 [Lentinula edodes]|uniref:Uncharacterized protein n=1 Tax=Lentinula lateritia TaxID=40482 RepID=A0A9W9B020_9AGAR|nr:hypothetical protein C8J55DRAFT_556095 [Lentinula edodes]